MKYDVFASVTGSKYLGSFEADSEEEALHKAADSEECHASFCHQCANNCEDPEVVAVSAEPAFIEDPAQKSGR